MFIEIFENPTEKHESFDFYLTKKLLGSENKFLDLSELIPRKVLEIIEKKNFQLIGHATFEKEGEVFDSSAFFPFGESFSEYFNKKKSGKTVSKDNIYKNLKGFNIPQKLNIEIIELLEKKYPHMFVVHKSSNEFRTKQLSQLGIEKYKEYPLSSYKKFIAA